MRQSSTRVTRLIRQIIADNRTLFVPGQTCRNCFYTFAAAFVRVPLITCSNEYYGRVRKKRAEIGRPRLFLFSSAFSAKVYYSNEHPNAE